MTEDNRKSIKMLNDVIIHQLQQRKSAIHITKATEQMENNSPYSSEKSINDKSTFVCKKCSFKFYDIYLLNYKWTKLLYW